MKNKLSLGALICLTIFMASCSSTSKTTKKADEDTKAFRYELEVVQTGTQGTYLVKVWSYSKEPTIAIEQAKKNAIHGIILKGFPGKQGIPGQVALARDPNVETEKAAFFNDFFKTNGDYLKFINVAGDGSIAPGDIMRIGKEYKIGVVVSVNVAELRKALETAGVIRSLDHGF